MFTAKCIGPYALTVALLAPVAFGAVPMEATRSLKRGATPAQDSYTFSFDEVSAGDVITMIGA